MPGSSFSEELRREPAARIRALSDIAAGVNVDNSVPARRYLRSGREMKRMADIYYEESNLESAFILYSKFITLFVEKLPCHQDYKEEPLPEKLEIKKKIKEVFPKAEEIKKLLLDKYTEEYLQWQKEKKEEELKLEMERKLKLKDEQQRMKQELERSQFQEEKQARILYERERQKHHLDDTEAGVSDVIPVITTDWPSLQDWEEGSSSFEHKGTPPSTAASEKPFSEAPMKPPIDRSTKPFSLLSLGPGPNVNARDNLRNIIVPLRMMDEFLKLASKNTEKGIETCGILVGQLRRNAFTITHLLIPKQRGTTDSCTTENEEQIFAYQDKNNLLTLGWIHTHPTQTSFMSSVDLHTQCAYQVMMPEAIAIVCAPKFNETGIYMLTPDYGLDFIAKCHQVGFHPHPGDPLLYERCNHVIMDDTASVITVDMRNIP